MYLVVLCCFLCSFCVRSGEICVEFWSQKTQFFCVRVRNNCVVSQCEWAGLFVVVSAAAAAAAAAADAAASAAAAATAVDVDVAVAGLYFAGVPASVLPGICFLMLQRAVHSFEVSCLASIGSAESSNMTTQTSPITTTKSAAIRAQACQSQQ